MIVTAARHERRETKGGVVCYNKIMEVNIYEQVIPKTRRQQVIGTVSVIIPNYNYADFIIERIDSVLLQTYPIHQIIILDDASMDNSIRVIERKIKEIKTTRPEIEVKFISNKKNSGGCVFAQWQKGIKEADGDYVWIAEADDSADRRFLEVAMKKFDAYPDSVLFYSDSYRINQDNKVISETCSDWADMWQEGRWKRDFHNNGKNEIINFLSGTNPILNVSSVVWKNLKELPKIFEGAKKFRVAGDWYIYTCVLEYGDIVYSALPLNYYRKHNKGSASTVIKLMKEYREVVAVQEGVATKYDLTKEQLEWQKVRRRGMGMVENKKNIEKKGRIAWLVPDFQAGSGGHRTIFQNVNYLIRNGYACDIYVKTWQPKMPVEIYNNIVDWYEEFDGDVYNDYELIKDYDMVVATGWETAKPASEAKCKNKVYFIQDFEPWFFPMGSEYIGAEMSYNYGLQGITIGRWLSWKMEKEFGMKTAHFDFCADLEKYNILPDIKKENAICFIFQPGKPRRCDALALRALQIVQSMRPEVNIYLYGSKKYAIRNLKVKHLGVLTTQQCNELYNRCTVGLCMSASNPSRIPFEMMAAGLPVVELYKENNLYDMPDSGVLLAEPTPEALATALVRIIDDPKLQRKMGEAGHDYMNNYPIDEGFRQFLGHIDNLFEKKPLKLTTNVRKKYNRSSVLSSNEVKAVASEIKKNVYIEDMLVKDKLVEDEKVKRLSRKLKRILKRIYLFIRDS